MSQDKKEERYKRFIFIAQIISVSFIWVLVVGITIWLLGRLIESIRLSDATGFSITISLVMIPVYWTLACILTYVFVGLRRNRMTD
ncbi:MAG: hypothetical protein Q8P24_07720 [Desulfobacterales bacterium]|nr:hypothetical protein [Desulfobacterales bacterium]